METFKKALPLCLAVVFLTVSLAGCGPAAGASEQAGGTEAGQETAPTGGALPDTPGAESTPDGAKALSGTMSPIGRVLAGEEEFFSVDDGQYIALTDIGSGSHVDRSVDSFCPIDLDGDGQLEAVLSLLVNGSPQGSIILHEQSGDVFGYTLWTRQFGELKSDGTFSYSGGAADNGFGYMSFDDGMISIYPITYSQSSEDGAGAAYVANGAFATSEEFMTSIEAQAGKPAAAYYDITIENIRLHFDKQS